MPTGNGGLGLKSLRFWTKSFLLILKYQIVSQQLKIWIVKFWSDNWIPKVGPCLHVVQSMESIIEGYLRDMIAVVSAGHRLASFQFLILTTISLQLRGILRIKLDHLSGSLKDLRSWLVSNIGSSANWRSNIPLWSSIFGMVCWKLWKSRNGFIFNGANCSAYNIILTSLAWARAWWKKAAGGGLLRDENGTWIFGYGRCLDERSVVQTEAWAMYNGLELHGSMDIRKFRDWTMVVQHISKEVNLIADCLVHTILFSTPPMQVLDLLQKDKTVAFLAPPLSSER
ncbi:hypothetical protein GOBAR_AA22129 [Gossypium barbadense]|uniref:RNase H type-1 domain-containing protein n=1 Tax=Gossypium barbadense TaxID=3634 RepID=A0A2P5X5C4_GOSBA|nr:hypothetical protein GOBAR_AA22129 [Gossypium barbadense]